jgi:two-component system response regulator FixJ
VLAGVADGLSNRLIGEHLMISPRTAEIHRANMLSKMGASHASEAIRIASEASLVDYPMQVSLWSIWPPMQMSKLVA